MPSLLPLGFLPPPFPLPSGQKHSVQPSHPRELCPGYLQAETPSAEDPKDVTRLPPGCTSGAGAVLASPFRLHQGLKERSGFELSSPFSQPDV